MTTPDQIAAIMTAATTAEQGRRQLASQRPGLGALMDLPEVGYGPGIGINDVPGLEVAGEGLPEVPEVSPAVVKSYGPPRPEYAAGVVGGVDFVAGRQEAPVKLAIGFRRSAGSGVTVLSPPRPSLWSRVAARLRGRR
jgi:hypothetical protein